jgi:hypothetical protein
MGDTIATKLPFNMSPPKMASIPAERGAKFSAIGVLSLPGQ